MEVFRKKYDRERADRECFFIFWDGHNKQAAGDGDFIEQAGFCEMADTVKIKMKMVRWCRMSPSNDDVLGMYEK